MPIAASCSGLAVARRSSFGPPVMLAKKLAPSDFEIQLGASSSARARGAISRNLGFECREYVVHIYVE